MEAEQAGRWTTHRVSKIDGPGTNCWTTLGDLPNLPGTASLAALGAAFSGADYVKAGLYGIRTVEEAIALMREVVLAVKDGGLRCKAIAAGYSDYRKYGCLNPLRLPEVALKSGADGVLVDVKEK